MREASPLASAHKLLAWAVPDAAHSFSRRDTSLYALSVGVGRDASDERQLEFVDPWHERLQALPTFPLVLGYPGFWLGGREIQQVCGFSAARVLHVEQSVRIHRPLPVAADVLGKTRILGLVDKGADKGSLLYSERDIVSREDNLLLATCAQVHYIRGFGGFGSTGFAVPPPRPMPTTAPDMELTLPTQPEQALLYRLNGDANPLHIYPAAAKAAGFERPILHGMCTAGVVMHGVLQALTGYVADRVQGFSLRMSAPLVPGESMDIQCWRTGAFRAVAAGRGITVIEGGFADIT